MEETKVIHIRIDLLKGLTDIAELQRQIDALTLANKNLDKSNVAQANQYAKNTVAIKEYRGQLGVLVKESANEIKTTIEKVGYMQKLKAEVSNLTLQYERLSKAELEGAKGGEVLNSLKGKREELSKLQQAYGNYGLQVGNYGSATKMLGINLGQVMKEMPNFAISARIGIMSLTNNLPMLAESIKAVRLEQQELITQGKAAPSMFGMITKSIFGLTGIMSIAMVLMQVFGGDIIKWVGSLFKGKEAVDQLTLSINKLNESVTGKMASEMEKIVTLAVDYNKASREGDKERIKGIEEIALKEYGVQRERLKSIADNVNNWRTAFSDYLELARKTYFNEFRIKEGAELEYEGKKNKAKADLIKANISSQLKEIGWSDESIAIAIKQMEDGTKKSFGVFSDGRNKMLKEYYEATQNIADTNDKLQALSLLKLNDIYSKKAEIETKATKSTKEKQQATFDYEQKLREANARAEVDDLYRQVELKRVATIKDQEELDKAYAEKLVTQEQYNTLSLAYAERLNTDISEIYQKYAKTQVKIIADQFEEEKKLRDKKYSDIDKEIEDRLQEAVNKARNDVDVAMMSGEESFQLKIEQLDQEAELEKTQAWIKLDAAKASETEIQEAMVAIDRFYAGKKIEVEKELTDSRLQMAAQVFGGISGLMRQGTIAQKIAATAEATINTYLGATAAYAAMAKIDPIVAAPLAAGAAILAGLANVKKIWEVDTSGNGGSDKANITKTTVTEKFATGGKEHPDSPQQADDLLRLTQRAERILTIPQTNAFEGIIGAMRNYGGAGSITSNVGVNSSGQAEMIASVVRAVMQSQKPPVILWKDKLDFEDKMARMSQNTQL